MGASPEIFAKAFTTFLWYKKKFPLPSLKSEL
jgi:hypothetical protein